MGIKYLSGPQETSHECDLPFRHTPICYTAYINFLQLLTQRKQNNVKAVVGASHTHIYKNLEYTVYIYVQHIYIDIQYTNKRKRENVGYIEYICAKIQHATCRERQLVAYVVSEPFKVMGHHQEYIQPSNRKQQRQARPSAYTLMPLPVLFLSLTDANAAVDIVVSVNFFAASPFRRLSHSVTSSTLPYIPIAPLPLYASFGSA